ALMSALVDSVAVDQAPLIGHVVGGQVTTPDGSRTQDVRNPATGEVTGRALLPDQAEVDAVVAGALEASRSWAQEPIGKRAGVLFAFREQLVAHTDELAATITARPRKGTRD